MAGLRVSGNKNLSCWTSQACSEFWPLQNNIIFAWLSMHSLFQSITEESRLVCVWIAILSLVLLVCEQGSKHWRLVKTMDWVKCKWPPQGCTQKSGASHALFYRWQHIRLAGPLLKTQGLKACSRRINAFANSRITIRKSFPPTLPGGCLPPSQSMGRLGDGLQF